MSDKIFIAEVKTTSPFNNWVSQYNVETLIELALDHGDWISIHTNPLWGGSYNLLHDVVARNNIRSRLEGKKKLKVVAKGLHATDQEVDKAIALGADYVVVVGRLPKTQMSKCLIEPVTEEQVLKFGGVGDKYGGVILNQRDLLTGKRRMMDPTLARMCKGFRIQASHIASRYDVYDYADGFIVGSELPQFCVAMDIAGVLKDE